MNQTRPNPKKDPSVRRKRPSHVEDCQRTVNNGLKDIVEFGYRNSADQFVKHEPQSLFNKSIHRDNQPGHFDKP